jgi:tRNA A37 methylthiotransferase MiaB
VLRAMRRFGDRESFLDLLQKIRAVAPLAGARSNVIVGFPGETEADVAELTAFLGEARLDAVGVFGYSDEDGTAAADLPGKLPDTEIAARVEQVSGLVDELVAQRAEDRIGERVHVLVERTVDDEIGSRSIEGRAEHQAPEVDGSVTVAGCAAAVGAIVAARVVGTDGIDLVARPDPDGA